MDDTMKKLEQIDRELAALKAAEQARHAADAPETEEVSPPSQPNARSDLQAQQDNRTIMILMIIASVLSLGIVSMLIYWLEVFLK